jgi:ABC-type Na+ efflux pump permease subunit
MAKVFWVAWREFKTTALTKAFMIAAVLVPVLMVAMGVLGPALFDPTPPPLAGAVAFVDPDGRVAAAAASEFDPARIEDVRLRHARDRAEQVAERAGDSMMRGGTDPLEAARDLTRSFEIRLTLESEHHEDELPALKRRVQDGALLALVTTGEKAGEEEGGVRLYVPSNMNVKHSSLLEERVRASISRANIEREGLSVERVRELSRPPRPQTVRISRSGEEKAEGEGAKVAKIMLPMAFMMLLWIGAFVSSNYLLTTTIEEKSNKIMEVLLSAVSPMQLMSGKIIGQALVGLVLVGMYLGMGVVALVGLAMFDLIAWLDLVYFALYFVMAYFMIASIMAAIGSAVNELREAQSLMTPAMIVLMIPLMLWLPISNSPNGTLATVTSFIPPLIPFVMVLRVTGDEPIALWQIIVSLAIGYPAMVGMIWLAARVFRVGVLMYGKPPSPLELLKWMRYS